MQTSTSCIQSTISPGLKRQISLLGAGAAIGALSAIAVITLANAARRQDLMSTRRWERWAAAVVYLAALFNLMTLAVLLLTTLEPN